MTAETTRTEKRMTRNLSVAIDDAMVGRFFVLSLVLWLWLTALVASFYAVVAIWRHA